MERIFTRAIAIAKAMKCQLFLLLLLLISSYAQGTTYWTRASGNWNANTTWSTIGCGNTAATAFPVAGDIVNICNGYTITVTANAACAQIIFTANNTSSTLQINSGITLNVSGAIAIPRANTGYMNQIAVGAGILNAGSIAFTNGGGTNRHQITISTGTITVLGDVTGTGTSSTISFSSTGLLQLGGALFTSTNGTLTTFTGSTVEYNGTIAQTIQTFTYANLIASGTNVKTLAAATTVNGTLTVRAGSTLALPTFPLSTPTSVILECGAVTGSAITGTGTLTLGGNVSVINIGTGNSGATINCSIALGATRTFTVANDGTTAADLIVSGIISGGFALIKQGGGTMVVSGVNSFSGGLTISAGTFQLGAANVLATPPFTLNGGTFSTGATIGYSETVGTLILTDNSTIALGTGSHTLTFAASNGVAWTAGKMLTITGWTGGYNGTSGTAGKIFVGANASGLTAGQLAEIQFFDGVTYFPAMILSTGEVVPSGTLTTGTILGSPFCSGNSGINVPFTYSPNAGFTGTFTAQLSNASGSFTSPTNLQSVASDKTGSQSISVTIPAVTPTGTGYRIRVVSSAPAINGTDNGTNLTINLQSADPTSATASPVTICNGGSSTLTLAGGGGGGATETIHWYTVSCGGTSVGTGNNFSVSPTMTTTYYGRYEDGAPCIYNSNCAQVTVTVNQKSADPTSATASSVLICNGQNTTLTLNGGGFGTGEVIHWYSGSCGGTAVGTGNNLTVSPTTTTTYYGRYEDAAPCSYSSACASVTITVNQKSGNPTSATATPATICNGSNSTLTLNGGGGGTGTVIHWYTVSCGGTSVGTGNNLTVSPTVTTTYYGRYEDGAPCSNNTTCASVTVTVNQKSADPTSATASANPICFGQSTQLTLTGGGGGTGQTIHWYTGSCGVTSAGTGSPIWVSPATTTTYYGRYEDGAPCNYNSACQSVTITVNPLPIVSITGGNSICINGTTTLSPTSGGTWVSNSPAIATVNNSGLVTGVSQGTATFTFTDGTTGCSSTTPGVTVNPTIFPSVSITASQNPVCTGTSVTFTATPTNGGTSPTYQWVVNSGYVGTNSPTYSYTPANNDNVSCLLTSNATCAAIAPGVSNSIIMSVGGPYSGTYTVGSSGCDFTSLTQAFTQFINCNLNGPVYLALQSNYNFSAEGTNVTLTIPQISSVNSTNTITVYPAATGLSLTSGNATGTLNFNGADYITFDGRVNMSGNASLVIENTTGGGYAIQFTNDATYNTIRYCEVRGINTSTTEGVIMFYAKSSDITGNDNNTIDHCNIHDGSSTPTNLIYSVGTATRLNNDNVISNSNLYNWFNNFSNSFGIDLETGNSDWSILNNSFYQTNPVNFSISLGIFKISAIRILNNNNGNNFNISGNYIGGQAPLCQGGPMTYLLLSLGSDIFEAINVDIGIGSPSNIQGNIIKNINYSTIFLVPPSQPYQYQSGISVYDGTCNILNNQIGDPSSPTSITFAGGSLLSYTHFYGITVGMGTGNQGGINISNNTIGGIYIPNATSRFTGINLESDGTVSGSPNYTISGNTIGSLTTAKSIENDSPNGLDGITVSTGSSCTISGNSIANLTIQSNNNANTNVIDGITASGNGTGRGIYTISNNTIFNLSSNSQYAGGSVYGIWHTASADDGQTISKNLIYSLANTSTSNFQPQVYGIYFQFPSTSNNIIEKNKIYSLSLSATNTGASMSGIYGNSGNASIRNNFIRLGINGSGIALTTGYSIYGIAEFGGSNSIDYNSVYIGGSGVTGTTSSTYALFSKTSANSRNYINNILENARTGGTGGKHYSIGLSTSGISTINNNDYYPMLGNCNGADYNTLPGWAGATGGDGNSFSGDPLFANATGGFPDLHITDPNSPCSGSGVSVSGIIDDIDGDLRPSDDPDVGADQFTQWLTWNGNTDTDWQKSLNWTPSSPTLAPPTTTEIALIPAGRPNYPLITTYNQCHCRDLVINSGGSVTITSGGSMDVRNVLTLNGTTCITVQSDASGTGSLKYGSLNGSGTANIQQYLTQDRWHYITSPISNALSGVFFKDWLSTYSEPTGAWGPYIIPTTTPLPPMTGYRVWASSTAITPPTKVFSGSLNSGTLTANLTRTWITSWTVPDYNGWNLTGNPYACPIDLESSNITWTNLDKVIYYWTGVAGNYLDYVAYGVGGSGGYGTASRYAPAMQGFFIHCNDPSATHTNHGTGYFTVTNAAMALDPNKTLFYKSTEKNSNCFSLVATSYQNSFYDKTMIYFDSTANSGFEADRDAYKWFGTSTAPQIYTKADSTDVSVNALPFTGDNMTIPLYFSCGLSGIYFLAFDTSSLYAFEYPIFLEDKLINTIVPFTPAEPYKLNYSVGDDPGRFILHFKETYPFTKRDNNPPTQPGQGLQVNSLQVYSFEKTVYVRNDNANLIGDVAIYNLLGTIVFRGKMAPSTISVFHTDLPPGVYMVSVITQDGNVNRKVVLR